MIIADICRNQYDAPVARPEARLFGVEIEVENGSDAASGVWLDQHRFRLTDDGSLRNAGREYISLPGTLRETVRSTQAWCRYAATRDWHSNHRTGIHVHVDMRDLTLEQVAGVCAAYAAFEPLFFAIAGADREENIYCVPWYRAPDQAEIVRRMAAGVHDLDGAIKYSALYLHPLLKFGTIEFRHAPTWQDPKSIRRWLTMISRIVEWSKDMTPADVLRECGSNPNSVAREVFGWTTASIRDPEELMDEADSLATVEAMLPCTYKVGDWIPPATTGDTEALGYHRGNRPRRSPSATTEEWATAFDALASYTTNVNVIEDL